MPDRRTAIMSERRIILVCLGLTTLIALCAWGGWLVAQSDLDSFILEGARDIRHEPVGPGMESLLFDYDGSVMAQTVRLYTAVQRRGWQVSQTPRREECGGQCVLGQGALIFIRSSLFDLVSEVVSVEQSGIGPYHVRVVLRRCIRVPRLGCWPSA